MNTPVASVARAPLSPTSILAAWRSSALEPFEFERRVELDASGELAVRVSCDR